MDQMTSMALKMMSRLDQSLESEVKDLLRKGVIAAQEAKIKRVLDG